MKMLTSKSPGVLPLPKDMTGKVCVLHAECLGARWKKPEFQLVRTTGGFGCHADKIGSKVFGEMLADKDEVCYRRSDFLGEASEELVAQVMAEATGELPIDPSNMVYMAIGTNFTWAKADTLDKAKRKVAGMGNRCLQVFYCHAETFLTDFGTLAWHREVPKPEEVWRRKEKRNA